MMTRYGTRFMMVAFMGIMALSVMQPPTAAAQVQRFSGDWVGSLDTPGGATTLAFTFVEDEMVLNGSTTGPDGTVTELFGGVINGSNVLFEVQVDLGGESVTLAYSGEMLPSANQIRLRIDVMGMTLETLLTRVQAQSFAGAWNGSFRVEDTREVTPVEFTFTEDGTVLTGSTTLAGQGATAVPSTYRLVAGGNSSISNGVIDGDTIAFDLELNFGGEPEILAYTGILSGNQLNLRFDFLGTAVEFPLTRMSEEEVAVAETAPPLAAGAMVRTIGCLEARPDNNWVLTSSPGASSTDDPMPSEGDALAAVVAENLGEQIVGLFDVWPNPEAHEGHRMEAKGLFMTGLNDRVNLMSSADGRVTDEDEAIAAAEASAKSGGVGINVISLEMIAETCSG